MPPLQTATILRNALPFKDAADLKLQAAFLELWKTIEPPLLVDSLVAIIAPSTTDDFELEPPDAETEWVIYAISQSSTVNGANADLNVAFFEDAKTLAVLFLYNGTHGQTRREIIGWPGNADATGAYIHGLQRPIIVRRNINKETHLRIIMRITTDATVGNRTHNRRWIYSVRPRTDF